MNTLFAFAVCFLACVSTGNLAESEISKNVKLVKPEKAVNDTKAAHFGDNLSDMRIKVSNVSVTHLKSDFGNGQIVYGNVSAVANNTKGVEINGTTSVKGNFTSFGITGSIGGSAPSVPNALNNTSVVGTIAHLLRSDNKTLHLAAVQSTVMQHGEKLLSRNMRMRTSRVGNEHAWPAFKHEHRSMSSAHKANRRHHLHRQANQKQVGVPQMHFYLPTRVQENPRPEDAFLQPRFNYEEQPMDNNFMQDVFVESNGGFSPPVRKLSPSTLMKLIDLSGNMFGGFGKSMADLHLKDRSEDHRIGYGAEETMYIFNRPEDKLLSFLHSMRDSKLIAAGRNQENGMSSPSGEQFELEIRCPIHHGAGKDTLGECTCDVLRN